MSILWVISVLSMATDPLPASRRLLLSPTTEGDFGVNWGIIAGICAGILSVWLIVLAVDMTRRYYKTRLPVRHSRRRRRKSEVAVTHEKPSAGSSRGVSRKEYFGRR